MKPDEHPPLRLILASASPRRRDLLASLGLAFTVRPAAIDESPRDGEPPDAYVGRLAAAKARAEGAPDELVLAADTVVALDGELLGKPAGPAEARTMLARLAGRRHEVFTGVALRDPDGDRLERAVARTAVEIAPLSDDRIAWYVDTGEPLDKAGAYAIQGFGSLVVTRIEGNYTNVVGLPLPAVHDLFTRLGHDLRTYVPTLIGSPRSWREKLAMIWWPLKSRTRRSSVSRRSAAIES